MEKAKSGTNNSNVVSNWTFRDGEQYVICLEVSDNPKVLDIRVTNKITSEEWSCHYDFKYIEELSHRTGNYKSFDIFIAMIKSALLKSTDSVELDLMTYEDLKTLKSKRIKNGGKFELFSPSKFTAVPSALESELDSNRNSSTSISLAKRKYLIMKYVAEFDSVHYPLPLSHTRGPDPLIMENSIKKLQGEVTFLRNTNQELVVKLKVSGDMDCSTLYQRNGREFQNEQFQNERFQNNLHGSETSMSQIRSLLAAIESLERKSSSERFEHLKEMEALQMENTNLRDQITELQHSEEELNRQISRLERMEHGLRRQESGHSYGKLGNHGLRPQRSGESFGTSKAENIEIGRNGRRESRNGDCRSRGQSIGLRSRHSSSSSEFRRKFVTASKDAAKNLSAGRNRSRTLSPAPFQKFDPTSYVRDKKMRQEQIAQMRMAQIKSNFQRQDRPFSGYSSPNGNDGGQSPRYVGARVPSHTELRLATRRERSLSLKRRDSLNNILAGRERGRSHERRHLTSQPTAANVGVQTRVFKPKGKIPNKLTTNTRVTRPLPEKFPRKLGNPTTMTSFGNEKKSTRADFEGSLEALQSYVEDTGQQLSAYKNARKALAGKRK